MHQKFAVEGISYTFFVRFSFMSSSFAIDFIILVVTTYYYNYTLLLDFFINNVIA